MTPRKPRLRKGQVPPRYEVLWHDAYTQDLEYTDTDSEPDKGYPTLSIGYCVRDDKHGITLATDVALPYCGQEMSFRGKHFIPRGMVVGKPKRLN